MTSEELHEFLTSVKIAENITSLKDARDNIREDLLSEREGVTNFGTCDGFKDFLNNTQAIINGLHNKIGTVGDEDTMTVNEKINHLTELINTTLYTDESEYKDNLSEAITILIAKYNELKEEV